MLKKVIKYKNYNDEEVEETCYFNLNKSELIELEYSKEGGLSTDLERIIATKDKPMIMKFFKKIILLSYGEKTADGRQFRKSEEISTAFSQTEAYNTLFLELCSNETAAANFINAVVPKDISDVK